MISGPVFRASVRDLCWLVVLVAVSVRWWMWVSKTLDTPRSVLPSEWQWSREMHPSPEREHANSSGKTHAPTR